MIVNQLTVDPGETSVAVHSTTAAPSVAVGCNEPASSAELLANGEKGTLSVLLLLDPFEFIRKSIR